jgi:antitoxin VapB
MSPTAKIFTHGRSQAVRLPKEFRLPGKEARVRRVGNKIILEPLDSPPAKMPWDAIDALGDTPFMPGGREQPEMPRERLLFEE